MGEVISFDPSRRRVEPDKVSPETEAPNQPSKISQPDFKARQRANDFRSDIAEVAAAEILANYRRWLQLTLAESLRSLRKYEATLLRLKDVAEFDSEEYAIFRGQKQHPTIRQLRPDSSKYNYAAMADKSKLQLYARIAAEETSLEKSVQPIVEALSAWQLTLRDALPADGNAARNDTVATGLNECIAALEGVERGLVVTVNEKITQIAALIPNSSTQKRSASESTTAIDQPAVRTDTDEPQQ